MLSFSQKNYPEWIVSPSGDTLLGFSEPQTQVLGEKLILKSYLVERNYELNRLYDLCSERCDALAGALELTKEEVAELENQIRLSESRLATIDGEIARLNKEIKKEERKKKFWKVVAGAETLLVTALTVIVIVK